MTDQQITSNVVTHNPLIPPKFRRPKILVIDEKPEAAAGIRNLGFDVAEGTFGQPYEVEKRDDLARVVVNANCPEHTEKELIVINLSLPVTTSPHGLKPNPQARAWGTSAQLGVVDPRPVSMSDMARDFDRILEHGGAFIVFTDFPMLTTFYPGVLAGHRVPGSGGTNLGLWGFLKVFDGLMPKRDCGSEIVPCSGFPNEMQSLKKFLTDGTFSCTLNIRYDNWLPLVQNKFGEDVGVFRRFQKGGLVILLPHPKDKVGFLKALVVEALPELCPHLFPDIEEGKWIHNSAYELRQVLLLKQKQREVTEAATKQVGEMEDEIAKHRQEHGWKTDLLTAHDDRLVGAVKKALERCGFQKVIDVDALQDAQGLPRREDLRIEDKPDTLIIDVKGVRGKPEDNESLQAAKHASMRMKEWKRTNVSGLTIINHERHMEPLLRENDLPFHQDLINAALEQDVGLLTTWDLFRLIRNIEVNGWPEDTVQPIFYRKGRISITPEHYSFLGRIANVFAKANCFGVILEGGTLSVGDRIAVEFAIEFHELPVTSIRVNDSAVERASKGDPAGLLWNVEKLQLREGMSVYRVNPSGNRPT